MLDTNEDSNQQYEGRNQDQARDGQQQIENPLGDGNTFRETHAGILPEVVDRNWTILAGIHAKIMAIYVTEATWQIGNLIVLCLRC